MLIVVEGTVEHGDRRGRELGFPTANISGADAVRLDGVYAGVLQVEPTDGGPSYVTAVSVGHRPTFCGRDAVRLLEAHLLDFAGDLYGKHVRVKLHVRLRPQRTYVDDRTLIRQLRLDVEAVRAWASDNGFDVLRERPSSEPRRSLGRHSSIRPRAVIRRKRSNGAAKSAERQKRREQRIRLALDERDARDELSPEWLAQRVGLPIGYARWYLGSLESDGSPT